MPPLQELMTDSDVRQMVDAQLDQVSTTTDDNCPLDYEAMMQDIDNLDQILVGIQYPTL